MANFEAATASFIAWLSQMGIQVNPKITLVDLRSENKGRGVVAIADIEEDEILFTIPRSSVLNTSTALDDSYPSSLRKALLQMPSWLALTTTMLFEGSRKDSKWAPYFSILPQSLDSLVFWSEAELLQLQASMVTHKIGKANAEEMFSKHISPLEINNVTPSMCHRVASVIMAYAFDIPEIFAMENVGISNHEEEADDLVSDHGEDEKTVLSMVPLADMLNADADRNNAHLCCDNKDLEMRAIRAISSGDEIFNDYGQLPRSDLLRRYGYITDSYSPYDVAEVPTETILSLLSSNIPLQLGNHRILEPLDVIDINKRTELAQREAIYEDSYDLAWPDPDNPSIPDELLALLYIFLVNNETLTAIEASEMSLPSRSKLLTASAGLVLVQILELREKAYNTTLEEDEAILQRQQLSHREAMAVRVRHGEKRVLRKAIQEATIFAASDKQMRVKDGATEIVAKGTKRKGGEINESEKRIRKR